MLLTGLLDAGWIALLLVQCWGGRVGLTRPQSAANSAGELETDPRPYGGFHHSLIINSGPGFLCLLVQLQNSSSFRLLIANRQREL